MVSVLRFKISKIASKMIIESFLLLLKEHKEETPSFGHIINTSL